jgi:hypothetical protein
MPAYFKAGILTEARIQCSIRGEWRLSRDGGKEFQTIVLVATSFVQLYYSLFIGSTEKLEKRSHEFSALGQSMIQN